ncbi:transposable element tc3 transposase [Plakobranchus ocellatus]|uniref:Transposable element tc3 transposase n=1 Tax=Plakobranchus ocellatus TaxID=259542 RepID=A0AAV3ZFC5_9GAST|nr:transposable element tc3 transposase [Plakobranchus ocellatus]
MCEWFCNVLENFLENVWFSDEAHFLLSGHVNSKNNVFWGSKVPDLVLQRLFHSVKCTAWVAISKHGIIGPFWFEDDDGRSQTINKERYMAVLNMYWVSLGRRRGVVRASQWFQQDGATPNTANETIAWLRQRFEERLISRRCDVEWAPHSSDLNPPRFLSVGFPQR